MAMVKSATQYKWRRFDKEQQDGESKEAFPTRQYAILIVGQVGPEEYLRVPWKKRERVKPGSVVVIPVGEEQSGAQSYDIVNSIKTYNPKVLIYDIVTKADLDGFTDNTSLADAKEISEKIRAVSFTNENGDLEMKPPTHRLVVKRTKDKDGPDDFVLKELNKVAEEPAPEKPEEPEPVPEPEPEPEPTKPVKPKKTGKGVTKPKNTNKKSKR